MKKVLLVILLLVLIVAVSYIKTVREHDRSQAAYEDGKMDAARELDAYQRETDSLKKAFAQQQLAFADSLVQKDLRYRIEVDSSENAVDSMGDRISTLSTQESSANNTSGKVTASDSTLSRHQEILTYYKRRYADLPKDLSEYEKRIAINEIKEETSLKFSISLSELKNIREKYKLTY
ncbi:MAG: hypothetical protein JSV52_01765 [Candidatus Zixiibacteriota bacterium]|nr:MAG: hypothetical protein JSV52_01765 [candidate division Zixibacteria bacterium]